jgi:hypothetical protein
MHINRRNFLHSIGAAATLTAFGGLQNIVGQKDETPSEFPIPAETYSQPLYSMTAKQFEQFIGREFSAALPDDGGTVKLILTEVSPIERLPNATRGFYGESFSLVFELRGKRRLEQDTYEFRTQGLEQFSALLVPTDRLMKRYEIIVNHLTR